MATHDETKRFIGALIRQLGDENYSFTEDDPAGGPSWDVYYVVHGRRPYTLVMRIGTDHRVDVGVFVEGTLTATEVRRALALQAPN